MDSILKLVYPYSYVPPGRGYTHHYYNGIHPKVIDYLNKQFSLEPNLFDPDFFINKILNDSEDKQWNYTCHSNFYHYFLQKVNSYDFIVDENGVVDDGTIYLYPIEIRTTLNGLTRTHSINLNGETLTYTFVETIPNKVFEYIKLGLVKILINIIHDPCTTSGNAESIQNFLRQFGIDGKNIIIIWGNNYQKIKIEMPNLKIKFTYGILPLQQQALSTKQFPRTTSLGYVSDIVREQDINPNVLREKRFLCFNRTMKPHRYMLAYLAQKHGLLSNSYFSFLNSNLSGEQIYNQLKVFKSLYTEIDIDSTNTIEKMIPYQLDTQELERSKLSGFTTDNNKKEFYLNSYIHLTSETLFESGDGNNPFFSEKTFRAIQNLQPFIFVGEPFSLKLLHSLGFKTFDPVIDESYDLETNPAKRMKMIESEIIRLNEMSIEELHKIYHSLIDICIYNQKHFITFADTNPFDNVFNDIKRFYSK